MSATVFSAACLRRQRKAAGISRDQLAISTSRTVSAISKYELGVLRPSAQVLGALAAALDCRVDDLFAADASRDGAA